MLPPRTRRWLAAILLVATVVRVGWCVYAARPPSSFDAEGRLSLHDPNFYLLYGAQFAHGNGYYLLDGTPSAYYPVGYPVALGFVFWITERTVGSHDIGAMAAFNIVCSVATVAVVFLIGRRLVNKAAGLAAAAVTALFPNLVFHTAAPLTESFYNLLLTSTVLVALQAPWAARRFERSRLVGLGLLIGVSILVRPVTVPIIAVLALAWIRFGFGWHRALTHAAAVSAVALVVVAPWLIRNVVVMDSLTLSTSTGDNLCMSRRAGSSGSFEFPNDRCFDGPFRDEKRPEFEVHREEHARRVALEFVREEPIEELKLWPKRVFRTFENDADGLAVVQSYGDNPFIDDRLYRTLELTANGYFFVTLGLSVVATPLLLRRREPAAFVVALLVPAVVIVPVIVTFGDPRFHVPALPFFALMSAATVAAAVDRRSRRA